MLRDPPVTVKPLTEGGKSVVPMNSPLLAPSREGFWLVHVSKLLVTEAVEGGKYGRTGGV